MARCRNDIADAEGYLHLVSSMYTEDQGQITQSTTRQVAVAVAVRMAMNDLLDGSILCGSIYTLYIVVAACQSVALRACGSMPVSAQRN